jgi:hypothetical protein
MGRARATAAAALLAAVWALPTQAQQATKLGDPPAAALRQLMLPSPPTGPVVPPFDNPRLAPDPDQARRAGCMPDWPCRLQLFGVIERNGGVGLKGTALTW